MTNNAMAQPDGKPVIIDMAGIYLENALCGMASALRTSERISCDP